MLSCVTMATFEVSIESNPPAPSKNDEDVTLTAKVKRTDDDEAEVTVRLAWKLGDTEVEGATIVEEPMAAGAEKDLTHTFKLSDKTAGTYSIGAKVGDQDQELGDNNSVKIEAPPSRGAGEPEAAVDPRDLVWDPQFALATGSLVGLLAIFYSVVIGVWAFSTDFESLSHFFVVTAGWVGGLTILAATWVVVLEMRGRAPKTVGEADSLPAKGIATDMLDKIDLTEIGKTLRSMRGMLAVLFIGFALFVLALILITGLEWIDDSETTTTSALQAGSSLLG